GGTNSSAYGISGDGRVVVGSSYYQITDAAGFHYGVAAYYFTRADATMHDLGSLGTVYPFQESAQAASANGAVIARYSSAASPPYPIVPFRWTAPGVYPTFPHPPGTNQTWVSDVSADGDVFVGGSRAPGVYSQGYRYRASTGAFDTIHSASSPYDCSLAG